MHERTRSTEQSLILLRQLQRLCHDERCIIGLELGLLTKAGVHIPIYSRSNTTR